MEKDILLRIASLEKKMNDLNSFSTIPFNTEGAFKERLKIKELAKILTSSKGAATENQSVSEAGVSSYSVLKPPDAFLQVVVSGITYYIPVFT